MRMIVSIASDPELLKKTWLRLPPNRPAILLASSIVGGDAVLKNVL